jgi:hypothetical protein
MYSYLFCWDLQDMWDIYASVEPYLKCLQSPSPPDHTCKDTVADQPVPYWPPKSSVDRKGSHTLQSTDHQDDENKAEARSRMANQERYASTPASPGRMHEKRDGGIDKQPKVASHNGHSGQSMHSGYSRSSMIPHTQAGSSSGSERSGLPNQTAALHEDLAAAHRAALLGSMPLGEQEEHLREGQAAGCAPLLQQPTAATVLDGMSERPGQMACAPNGLAAGGRGQDSCPKAAQGPAPPPPGQGPSSAATCAAARAQIQEGRPERGEDKGAGRATVGAALSVQRREDGCPGQRGNAGIGEQQRKRALSKNQAEALWRKAARGATQPHAAWTQNSDDTDDLML